MSATNSAGHNASNRSSNVFQGSMGKTDYRLSISNNPSSRRSSLGHENVYTEMMDTRSNTADGDYYYNDNTSTNNNNTDTVNNDYDVLHKYLLPQINELHDSFITMENNYLKLNYIHNNLVDLNESFGSLLYGLIINSACYQFPNFPNNVGQQLDTISVLNKLNKEKQELQQELQILKMVPKKTEHTNVNVNTSNNVTNKKYLSNMHPPATTTVVTQGKRINNSYRKVNEPQTQPHLRTVQQYNNIRHTQMSTKPHTRINAIDTATDGNADPNVEADDNSSEASFIMDPTLDQRRNRQYRRKSILNVIRNSNINSHTDENNAFQLNGRARRVQPVPTGRIGRDLEEDTVKNAGRIGGTITTGGARGTLAKSTRNGVRKPTPLNKRPPFR